MGTLSISKTIDVLEILTSQHDQIDVLFAKLEAGKVDRVALFVVLADQLAAHATVEERIFYPAVMSKQTSRLLHKSVDEHLEIKRVLADLIDRRLSSAEFETKLKVLRKTVTHHAREEEEQKLFPMLRKTMSLDERATLGKEVLAMFEDLMKYHPYRTLPVDIDEAAPLPDA